MPPAARIGDNHVCPLVTGTVPHVGGPIAKGEPTVMIGNMPAARVGDMVTCTGPPDTITKGSMTVLIGNMPAARLGDLTAHGGSIVVGFPTVDIGDMSAGGGGGGAVGVSPSGGSLQNLTLIAAKQSAAPFCEICQGVPQSAIASPSPRMTPPRSVAKPRTTVCSLTTLTIKCAHKERKYVLVAGAQDTAGSEQRTLEVKAGPEGDVIDITTQLDKPYCSNHLQRPIVTSPTNCHITSKAATSATAKLTATPAEDVTAAYDRSPFSLLWLPSVNKNSFDVNAPTCGNSEDAEIVVYPAFKWTLTITALSFSGDDASDSSHKKKKAGTKATERSRGIEVALKYGSRERKLGVEFEHHLKHALSAGRTIQSILNKVLNWVGKFGDVDLSIVWPSITLEGEWEYAERSEHWAVGLQGKASLKLDPLIGLEFNWNIINTALKLIPPLGAIVLPAKKAIEEVSGMEVGIYFKATGQVGFSLDAERTVDEPKWDFSGEVSGSIELELSGGIEPEGEDKWIEFSVGGKSGVTISGKPIVDSTGIGIKDGSLVRDEVVLFLHAAISIGWEIKCTQEKEWTLFDEDEWWSQGEPFYVIESHGGGGAG